MKNLRLRVGNLAARIPTFPRIPSITLRGNALRVTAYIIYALILGGILLLWKFPYSSLQQRLESMASRASGMRVELNDLSLSFPPGLTVSRCVVRPWGTGREPVLDITEGSVRFGLIPLFRGKVEMVLHGRAYGGRVTSDCSFGRGRQYQLKAVLQSLRLEESPGIAQLLGRQVSGTLSGELQVSGTMGDTMKSNGGGKIQLHQGRCPVNSPYLKVKSLDDVEVNATAKLGEGTLTVEACDFKATGIQGTLKGVVSLAPTLSESTLELAGEGQVDEALLNLEPAIAAQVQPLLQQRKPMPFHVRGTLAAPQFSIF